ncbi:hypothetical protein CEXT_407361 [Caerostris extrusa]|uniref:Uncharacterized protein n=1 Tax=Caerostris extrusa TaxID=172846 RepID=A0AAV4XT34_CAEEX|nr:hypothetical protein CEXT_407361 [Caerostris extrusa]
MKLHRCNSNSEGEPLIAVATAGNIGFYSQRMFNIVSLNMKFQACSVAGCVHYLFPQHGAPYHPPFLAGASTTLTNEIYGNQKFWVNHVG